MRLKQRVSKVFEFSLSDDLDFEDVVDDSSNKVVKYQELSEDTVVPKRGVFLGLDISQNSSGIGLYKNGEKFLYNSSLDYREGHPHAEALLRKQLKSDLLEVIDGVELDLIIIEDVYEGSNPEIVRRLYALNTAIDDLILDGEVTCKEFLRVSNVTWKSWLSVVDTENKFKGYKDKEKIQRYLEILGVTDSGEGFQDRLDATGMVIGYFLKGKEEKGKSKKKSIRVSINDIVCAFEEDPDLIALEAGADRDETVIVQIGDTRMSKAKVLDYLSGDFSSVFITAQPIRLGLLAETFNLSLLGDDKGYFGFWMPVQNQKKYFKRLEKRGEANNDYS